MVNHLVETFEHLVVVQWFSPTPSGAEEVIAHVRRLYRAKRSAIALIVVVPESCSMPNQATRAVFSANFAELRTMCESIQQVIEGSSLRISLLRTLMRAIAHVGKVEMPNTHATFEEALRAASPELRRRAPEILTHLGARGMRFKAEAAPHGQHTST